MYLDNNASTPCDPEIIDIFQSISLDLSVSNPHSTEHKYGWNAEEIIIQSQNTIADFINALPEEIIFTSGATESNNMAIIGSAMSARIKSINKNKIIVSAIEHKCILNSAQHVKNLFGFEIVEISVNDAGIVSLDELEKEIDDQTLIVSIMAVNNEIGTVQPIKKIGELCRKNKCIFHVDAAQAGYFNLDVISNNIDMLSLSGHKLYAPKGIGALYVSDGLIPKLTPIIHGGGQQGGIRAGTLSPALCASMAKAMNIISETKEVEFQKLKSIRNLFLRTLEKENISHSINGCMNDRHPGNLNIQLHDIDASALILRLQPNLAISTGSACNSGVIESSYVLKAIGLNDSQIESSIRIGFGRFNTIAEAEEAGKLIANEIMQMRLNKSSQILSA